MHLLFPFDESLSNCQHLAKQKLRPGSPCGFKPKPSIHLLTLQGIYRDLNQTLNSQIMY